MSPGVPILPVLTVNLPTTLSAEAADAAIGNTATKAAAKMEAVATPTNKPMLFLMNDMFFIFSSFFLFYLRI